MKHLFAAIVPGWKGRPLPAAFPRHVRIGLVCSIVVVDLFALTRYGRTFSLLSQLQREAVVARMATHRVGWLRMLVQWWKVAALVTGRQDAARLSARSRPQDLEPPHAA